MTRVKIRGYLSRESLEGIKRTFTLSILFDYFTMRMTYVELVSPNQGGGDSELIISD